MDGAVAESELLSQCPGEYIYKKLQTYREMDRFCIVDLKNNKTLNYRELLETGVKLAIALEKFGVKYQDTISIISVNNWQYIAILLSSLFMGTTLCPINPNYTPDELTHNIKIVKPKVIICNEKLLTTILDLKSHHPSILIVITIDDELETLLSGIDDKEVNGFYPTKTDPDSVALLMSSSGTTGLPKQVMITMQNIMSNIMIDNDPVSQGLDRRVFLGYLPFFHAFGYIVNLSTFCHPTTLVIIEKFSPHDFLKAIQNYGVTKLHTVPTILSFLAETPLLENYDVSSLKDIVVAAAPISTDLGLSIKKRLNGTIIRQCYGLSETFMISCNSQISKKFETVGKPFEGYQLKIVDIATEKNANPEQKGEIRFKSPSVMKGYLNNETATAEAFDKEGYLKTGDLGYVDSDGDVFICGRLKEIIKFKGFQISPTELENVIKSHPAVEDVGVVGKNDVKAGEIPAAFVVRKNNTLTEEEIINFVAEKVSNYKHLRGGVIFIEKIPRNTMGKILRGKLKQMLI